MLVKGPTASASEPEEHLAVADADDERRALASAHDEIVLALDHRGDGEGAAQLVERALHGVLRGKTLAQRFVDQVGDGFAIGLGLKFPAALFHGLAQFAEVLDDAVVDDGDTAGGVRVGVGLVGLAVRRPAGVADADRPLEFRLADLFVEIAQLAGRAQAFQPAAFKQRDAGGIIAPVFQPLQRLDQAQRNRLIAQDTDDAAHVPSLRTHPPNQTVQPGRPA